MWGWVGTLVGVLVPVPVPVLASYPSNYKAPSAPPRPGRPQGATLPPHIHPRPYARDTTHAHCSPLLAHRLQRAIISRRRRHSGRPIGSCGLSQSAHHWHFAIQHPGQVARTGQAIDRIHLLLDNS